MATMTMMMTVQAPKVPRDQRVSREERMTMMTTLEMMILEMMTMTPAMTMTMLNPLKRQQVCQPLEMMMTAEKVPWVRRVRKATMMIVPAPRARVVLRASRATPIMMVLAPRARVVLRV
jgi:hypothetical protein